MFLAIVALLFAVSAAQILVAPGFSAQYSVRQQALTVPGVPGPYSGITFADANTILIGGAANTDAGAIYRATVTRDGTGHINGFQTAILLSTAPYIDGGLLFGPGGVLFFTGYPVNTLGQIKQGSVSPNVILNLNNSGIVPSVGSLAFVPPGFPGAGKFKIASAPTGAGYFYDATLVPDGFGTFTIGSATEVLSTGVIGPEGIIYVPFGSPSFPTPSVLVGEFDLNRTSAYTLDSNGTPVASSRQDFLLGLTLPNGAALDPLTGDLLATSSYQSGFVAVVSGLLPPVEPVQAE